MLGGRILATNFCWGGKNASIRGTIADFRLKPTAFADNDFVTTLALPNCEHILEIKD